MKQIQNIFLRFTLWTIILLHGDVVYCQFDGPPVPAEATNENRLLIDSLVKVSKFDLYFIDYASSRIDLNSAQEGWTPEQVSERKARIDVKKFLEHTVYNSFALLTSEELEQLITLMGKLNIDQQYSFYVFTTSIIENNMDIYVNSRYLK